MTNAVKVVILFGFAAVLAFTAGLLLMDAPMEYGLDCNRVTGGCTFTQNLLARTRTGWARIDSLEGAEVREHRARRGAARIMVWVKSKSASGDYFFADYVSRREAEEAARRINAFLRDPSDGRLVLTRGVRATYWVAWASIPLLAALVVALAAALFSKKRQAGPSASSG